MPTEKIILHMDGDAFFVGVEVAKNPKLKGLPVVTGAERGIVSALSYEAKALGVTRGMPIFHVRRDFPHVVVLPGDYASYARYSSMMFDVVRRYAYGIEEYSIDECFADITGLDRTLKKPIREIASQIQNEVESELGLSVTIGIAPTKVLAKIASKLRKPHGLTILDVSSTEDTLANTPIESLWGIGPRIAVRLRVRGILSALDFTKQNIGWVRHHFAKPQEAIWHELRGVSVYPVNTSPKSTYGSMQRTRTFSPVTTDPDFLMTQLKKHVEDACVKARRYNLVPRKLMLYLRTNDFQSMAHIVTLAPPTASPSVLLGYVQKNFSNVYVHGVQYRSAGITLLDLSPCAHMQGNLFALPSDAVHKFASIHTQIDALEEKYGKSMVHFASTHAVRGGHKAGGTEFEDMGRNLLFL